MEKCVQKPKNNYYQNNSSKKRFSDIEDSCNKELVNLENCINNLKQLKLVYRQTDSQTSNLEFSRDIYENDTQMNQTKRPKTTPFIYKNY